ncbi:hypothetical protein DXU92_12980 [Brachybacterium saurashtrense]|uniref:DUF4239 domain-containing protein n=1 Tax=Brachybacterium saurashtrense TaxID=556288 RepID=A0A345YTB1_9MICO|nr:hypothetical protein DWV08_04405 [Brachybacterium saurashtrense]RRR21785.1 hypothetical protein DXU92_12980 [Brachybacterium saurashtrense]
MPGRRRGRVEVDERSKGVLEYISVVTLAVTALLTAWSGFEASKWGGEMSIAFSRASSARIEASRYDTEAEAARNFDLQVFSSYVEAVAIGDENLEGFVRSRFTDHFTEAFEVWIAMDPLEDPDAPEAPFGLEEYSPPGRAEAIEADARADQHFEDALTFNRRGDNYTLLTVLFATVLFFVAISQRQRTQRMSFTLLACGEILFVIGVVCLVAFPKII